MSVTDASQDPIWLRPRIVVAGALALLTLLAWAYLLWIRAGMMAPSPEMPSMTVAQMAAMASPGFSQWSAGHFFFIFAMWTVMMVGMMLPTVTPMLLLYARLAEMSNSSGRMFASTGWFAGGYLLAWTGFSLIATLAQYAFEQLAFVTPMMESANLIFGGGVLVAVGIYQWTPLKSACLSQCRAPLSFVQRHGGFRTDKIHTFRLGMLHGAFCVGCCWALMALLFVGGAMNILWIAGLMIFVLAEKILPGGQIVSKIAGLAAVAAGIWFFASAGYF